VLGNKEPNVKGCTCVSVGRLIENKSIIIFFLIHEFKFQGVKKQK